MSEIKKNLNKIVVEEPSKWVEITNWRIENEGLAR